MLKAGSVSTQKTVVENTINKIINMDMIWAAREEVGSSMKSL